MSKNAKTIEDKDGVRHRDDEAEFITNDARVKPIDDKIDAVQAEYRARMKRLRREREQVATAVEMEHLRAEVARLSGGRTSAGPAQPEAAAKPADDVA